MQKELELAMKEPGEGLIQIGNSVWEARVGEDGATDLQSVNRYGLSFWIKPRTSERSASAVWTGDGGPDVVEHVVPFLRKFSPVLDLRMYRPYRVNLRSHRRRWYSNKWTRHCDVGYLFSGANGKVFRPDALIPDTVDDPSTWESDERVPVSDVLELGPVLRHIAMIKNRTERASFRVDLYDSDDTFPGMADCPLCYGVGATLRKVSKDGMGYASHFIDSDLVVSKKDSCRRDGFEAHISEHLQYDEFVWPCPHVFMFMMAVMCDLPRP